MSEWFDPQYEPAPLLSVAQLRACETAAQAVLPPHALMARAGAAAARLLLDELHVASGAVTATDASKARSVWIAAGPGNNGGDALVVATYLHQAGVPVEVCMPVDVKPDDARWALANAKAAGVSMTSAAPASAEALDDYGWLIDGLFGIGLARGLDGAFATLAQAISMRARRHGHVLALDTPSGLDSDTGNVVGNGPAVHATHTITFIAAKPGLFTASGRDYAGKVYVAPIGIDEASRNLNAPNAAHLNAPASFAFALPVRSFSTHKGTFGTLAVLGGDTGMCGAPILAARAALYAGAGKVHIGFMGHDAPPYDALHPELMLHAADELPPVLDRSGTTGTGPASSSSAWTRSLDAIAIGCGMGTSGRARILFERALRLAVPTLIDADALNLIAQDAALAEQVMTHAAHAASRAPCVLTPHPLEAARLLGADAKTVQRDRLAAARALAARFASVIVLKGSGTVIAAPDGQLAVNPTGNAGLASGGSGDVLGGLIGALLAQRLPPFAAALAGVYLHGLAADTLSAEGNGPAGLTASELAPRVRQLLNQQFYQAGGILFA